MQGREYREKIMKMSDEELIRTYDTCQERKKQIEQIMKQIREEALRRLNDRKLPEITLIIDGLERGYQISERTKVDVDLARLKEIVGDRYGEIVQESKVRFVKFIKRKAKENSGNTGNAIDVPEGVIL